tara:strand:+ start:1032 stop:1271 length:240 start_codon:yes stop_codon:yes gene_type:complete
MFQEKMSLKIILRIILFIAAVIILYKFMFGFLLPIAMFVFLGSILKLLLQTPEIDLDETSNKEIIKSNISSQEEKYEIT